MAYDDVYLRPQDYTGLTQVTPIRSRSGESKAGPVGSSNSISAGSSFPAAGVNYNPSAGRVPVIGHEDQGNFNLTFHASGRLRIDNTYLLEHIRERDTNLTAVTNHIVRSKWNYQFTRELSARVILQYTSVLSEPADQFAVSDQELQRRLPHHLPGTPRHGDLRGIQQQPAEPRPAPAAHAHRPAHHPRRLHQRRPPVLCEGLLPVPLLKPDSGESQAFRFAIVRFHRGTCRLRNTRPSALRVRWSGSRGGSVA